MNGRLIVFEGIDGTGKSTQLERLALALEAAGHEVVRTGEPYADCDAGRRIREMARSGEAVSRETELAWFQEQRREHVREIIGPALARGAVVLADRYYLSTVAYQGARGLDWQELLLAHEEEGFPEPDLVLLFDMDPTESLARASARGGHAEPVFEEQRFLEAARAIYLEIERAYLQRIDAAQSPDIVAVAVGRAVASRLGLL